MLAGMGLALALQTTLARLVVGGSTAIDLVLVAVVAAALTAGPTVGLVAGSVAGLAQDALSSDIMGVGGLAKSTVGFVTGVVGQQFIVTAPLPRFVMFIAATVLHAAVFMGLYTALGLRTFASPWAAIGSQALGNAIVGLVGFTVVEALPGMIERRRLSRRVKT